MTDLIGRTLHRLAEHVAGRLSVPGDARYAAEFWDDSAANDAENDDRDQSGDREQLPGKHSPHHRSA